MLDLAAKGAFRAGSSAPLRVRALALSHSHSHPHPHSHSRSHSHPGMAFRGPPAGAFPSERTRNNFKGLATSAGSRGQNLALTVLSVTSSSLVFFILKVKVGKAC